MNISTAFTIYQMLGVDLRHVEVNVVSVLYLSAQHGGHVSEEKLQM